MKKKLLVLAMLFFFSLGVIGQSKLTEPEVKKMLCHKWGAVSLVIQGKQIPPEENIYITFLPDGTFIDSQKDYSKSKDKWTYTHPSMTITSGGVPKKIIIIDDTQLKLKAVMNGQIILTTLKRAD